MTTRRPTLSVVMITFQAERLLERVLESVSWADEIVIVDRGSTDATEEIARRYTAHFHHRAWAGFGVQKQRALELATGDWVLVVDADEVVTPALRRGIEAAVVRPGDAAGFQIKLLTCFAGHWFGSRGWRHDLKPRLFRRDSARFPATEVHEAVEIDGPLGRVAGVMLHFSYRDVDHHTDKMNRYSSGLARQLYARGRRSGPVTPAVRGFLHFLRDYLLGGEFLYGGAGFVRASLAGYYTFLKYVKLWELGLESRDCAGDVKHAQRGA